MTLPVTYYLDAKLRAAGIPIDGVDSTGRVDYQLSATPAQRDQGASIVAAFDWTLAAELAAEAQVATNELTIGQKLDLALAANDADVATNNTGIAQNDAWLAANTGTNLSTTVLTAQVKKLTQQNTAAARQRNATFRELNGLIRLLRRKLDSTAGT